MKRISDKRKRTLAIREERRERVIIRDQGLCVWCGAGGHHVHEIVYRSAFGHAGKPRCYTERNMVTLCKPCHDEVHAGETTKAQLMALMQGRYGYEYNEEPWSRYVKVHEEAEEEAHYHQG
jgi:5-methylcytosine-specific restriction endonuclease McrA